MSPSNPQDAPNPSNWLLQICLWNCRSLVNKLSEFQSYVYSCTHDVFVLTETWLSQDIFDKEILPTAFNIYCNDRASRGGGVLIAINNSFPSPFWRSKQWCGVVNNFLEMWPKWFYWVKFVVWRKVVLKQVISETFEVQLWEVKIMLDTSSDRSM